MSASRIVWCIMRQILHGEIGGDMVGYYARGVGIVQTNFKSDIPFPKPPHPLKSLEEMRWMFARRSGDGEGRLTS